MDYSAPKLSSSPHTLLLPAEAVDIQVLQCPQIYPNVDVCCHFSAPLADDMDFISAVLAPTCSLPEIWVCRHQCWREHLPYQNILAFS